MTPTPRFFAFWAINDRLDLGRLRAQLEAFKSHGLDGVVWHPRFYPNEPAYLGDDYLRIVSEVILHAKALGLAFWIYDEDGWPSGTVGGQLLRRYPDDAQHWAGLYRERPERVLAEFDRDGGRWYLGDRIGGGVDYFKPALARHFLEMTYERYRQGLAPEAFAQVETFFCDEPEFGLGHAYDALPKDGALPWTPGLPEAWRARHGEELAPLIPLLFFAGERAAEVRVKFWELLTDLFNAAFVAPINAWCASHGKRFTAHVKGEEHPLFQIPTSGSCHQVFRNLSLPGIDALERFPANDFFPRQVSSAARQFGDGRCMAEAFGGSGWGGTPEDLERYLLWLGRNGVTDFVMHLSQYRLDSAALHDWPPSQPLHLTWSAAYADVLGKVRVELAAHPRREADTLVVAPYRVIAAEYSPEELMRTNVHNAATYPDTAAGRLNRRFMAGIETLVREGVAFDVADERSVEERGERLPDGRLRLGNCVYRRVLAAAELASVGMADFKAEATGAAEAKDVGGGGAETMTPHWRLVEHPVNSLLLDCEQGAEGGWFAVFCAEPVSASAAVCLRFADEVRELTVNGIAVPVRVTDDGAVAELGIGSLQARNRIRFRRAAGDLRPFVWLEGRFHVASESAFVTGPDGTVKTEGPWRIGPARPLGGAFDLLTAGYPFLRAPLCVETEFSVTGEARVLRFDGLVADAFRVSIDGTRLGWSWLRSGGASVELAVPLGVGAHVLRLELVPNGYNSYGPHHYHAGDWHVVSPDQIKGVRNFADAPDAPERTHVSAWHFRSFRLPTTISALL